MAIVNGTVGNDFIHVAGDGLVAPGGYTDNPGATSGNDVINPRGGSDYVYSGGGDDEIDISNTSWLTGSTTTIDGGPGYDTLYLSNVDEPSSTFTADITNRISRIEAINTPISSIHAHPFTMTLTDMMVGSSDDSRRLTIYLRGGIHDTVANTTIDGSAITNAANSLHFYDSAFGTFDLIGGGGADVFTFGYDNALGNVDLYSSVILNGGTGSSIDLLEFTWTLGLYGADFTNVSHIEQIKLSDAVSATYATNSISIPDSLASSADDGQLLTIQGGTAADTIDLSAAISAGNRFAIYGGGAADTITLPSLVNGDTVDGGNDGAIDTLAIATASTIASPALINVSHIEVLQLADGANSIALTDTLVGSADDGHILTVKGGTGADTIDAGAVTSSANSVIFDSGGGNDHLTGGAGNDTAFYTGGFDVFDGGGGNNTIDLSRFGSAIWFGFNDPSGIEVWTKDNSDYDRPGTDRALVNVSHVENVTGTAYNDQINGDNADNTYTYTGGFDLFDGHGGDNTLDLSRMSAAIWFGFNDPNGIEAWTKDNTDYDNPGADRPLVNSTNVENVIGTIYNDQINGDDNDNTYTYTNGFDLFDGHGGNNTLDLSRMSTAIWFGYTDPSGVEAWTFFDSAGHTAWRALVNTTNVENVIGTAYSDQFTGDDNANTYTYTGGFDIFAGAGGSDTLDMSWFGSAIWYGHTDPSGIEAWTRDNSDYNNPGTDRALVDTFSVENVIGTAYNDQIYGDNAANRITGGSGADLLYGQGGGDTYAYVAVSDSTGPTYDSIVGFDTASDRFDLRTAVTGIDTAVTSGFLSSLSFDPDLASILTPSYLGASRAVLVTPSSGDLAGHTFLVVDANNTAGYQAAQDFVFELHSPANLASLATSDFI